MKIYWKPLHHPIINDGYLISNTGMIRHKYSDEKDVYKSTYHSTNGYDYAKMVVKESKRINDIPIRLFPIDEIVGYTFIPIPEDLIDKPKIINHINGDTRDISLDNLEWIEDVEEWKTCTYPGIKPNTYEISSWGNLRNIIHNKLIGNNIDNYYIRNSLRSNEGKSHFSRHRMVIFQFGVLHKNDVVNHIDGIKNHNHWKNLESVSIINNNEHAKNMGLIRKYERHPMTNMTKRDIDIICDILIKHKLIIDNTTMDDIRDQGINISKQSLFDIRSGRTWSEYTSNRFKYETKYTSIDDVENICKLLVKHDLHIDKSLMNDLKAHGINVSKCCVESIRCGHTHKKISRKYFTYIKNKGR